jgi:hypothetical protein
MVPTDHLEPPPAQMALHPTVLGPDSAKRGVIQLAAWKPGRRPDPPEQSRTPPRPTGDRKSGGRFPLADPAHSGTDRSSTPALIVDRDRDTVPLEAPTDADTLAQLLLVSNVSRRKYRLIVRLRHKWPNGPPVNLDPEPAARSLPSHLREPLVTGDFETPMLHHAHPTAHPMIWTSHEAVPRSAATNQHYSCSSPRDGAHPRRYAVPSPASIGVTDMWT